MKKLFFLITLSVFFAACSSGADADRAKMLKLPDPNISVEDFTEKLDALIEANKDWRSVGRLSLAADQHLRPVIDLLAEERLNREELDKRIAELAERFSGDKLAVDAIGLIAETLGDTSDQRLLAADINAITRAVADRTRAALNKQDSMDRIAPKKEE